jgi:peroxiredoxin
MKKRETLENACVDSLYQVPPDLSAPVDDGAATHLIGMGMPSVRLVSTKGRVVDLSQLGPGRTVIYLYPRTGLPDRPTPAGWDKIPGARGCTPESCGFRDHFRELSEAGASVFGLSTQDTDYQREAVERLALPFELLSDARFLLTDALQLPTFVIEGVRLLKRLTLVLRDGSIEHVFYPVFPPDGHAEEVLKWLSKT